MPGNPDGFFADKHIFHPKSADIVEFVDLIRPEFLYIVETLHSTEDAHDIAEFLLEELTNALFEFTFPDDENSMRIFS
jgi:hypothetical protein